MQLNKNGHMFMYQTTMQTFGCIFMKPLFTSTATVNQYLRAMTYTKAN